ncbi:hypothetical protein CPAV1605_193 [seawater metagenome]|uniref:RING-type domain-containing protein n=1 Tax=seawater metagenome TaxID=1561972 RepID=A0A5E8CH07_9ZZZZ
MTSYIFDQNNKIYNCSYCLTDQTLGSIKKNKFLINPKLWNFEILHCGHIICKNCFTENDHLIDKCGLCRQDTKVYEMKLFHGINYNKSWKTLSQWFEEFNGSVIRVSIKNWKPNKQSFSGIYACIRDKSLLKIKSERQRLQKIKEKKAKEQSILNSKIQKELKRITPKRKLYKGEYEKLLIQAEKNVKENTGSFKCQKCSKTIPAKHKHNHLQKCL